MYLPEELLQSLKSGSMASLLGDGAVMAELELGMLDLPGGHLVAADPLGNDAVPFAQRVAPGRYPVVLHVVRDSEGEEIVAFAEVRLSAAQPVRYEMALTGEEDTSEPLEQDGFFGFEAEEGFGGFWDASLALRDAEVDAVEDALIASFRPRRMAVLWQRAEGQSLAAFSCGFGDGAYPSFWGFDAGGAPCCLIVDFLCFSEADDELQAS